MRACHKSPNYRSYRRTYLQFDELLLHNGDTLAAVVHVRPQLFHFVSEVVHVGNESAVQVSRGTKVLKDKPIVVLLPCLALGIFDDILSECQARPDVSDVSILLHEAVALLNLRAESE